MTAETPPAPAPARKPGPNTVAGVQPRSELGRFAPADDRLALTDQQAKFAEEYVLNGGNASAAARAAGYAAGTEGATGFRLVRLPWVQRAIEIARKRFLSEAGAAALRFIVDTIRDEDAAKPLRLKAAEIAVKTVASDRDTGKNTDQSGKRAGSMTVAELETIVARLTEAERLATLPVLEHNEQQPAGNDAQVIDPAE